VAGPDGKAPSIRDAAYAELARDHPDRFEYMVMRRDQIEAGVLPGEPDGELFDLKADPGKPATFWSSRDYAEKRIEPLLQLAPSARP
jgi:hypothetical protein